MSLVAARPNTLLLLVLALAGILAAGSDPVWLDSAVVIAIHALIALSVGLSYGQAGILSMAQGALAALGAYTTAILCIRLEISPWIALAAAIALPAGAAYLLALLVTRLAPLAVALATLALGTLVSIVIRHWDSLTGGYIGMAGIPAVPGIGTTQAWALLAWGFVCLAVLLYENLMRSAQGRSLNTIRSDRMRALADGVNVPHLLSAAFALSAAMAGAAGWLYAHYVSFLAPESLDVHLSIQVLLMAVVGGVGYVLGPVVGALLLDLLMRFLPAAEVQGLFFGGALIIILIVAREGLLGLILPPLQRRLQRRALAAAEARP